jgi:hypothetical protein
MEVGLPESEWKIATTPDDVGLDRLKYTIQMIQLAVLGSAL